jgi:hypothetical protein
VSFGDLPPSRITDLVNRSNMNVSTVDRGLIPPLNNAPDQFLNGAGAWATPAGMTDPLTERGSLIFRNATIPAELLHSTAGYYLKTKGHNADPIWDLLNPESDNTGSLGASNLRWGTIYGTAIYCSSLRATATIYPDTDNTGGIGANNIRWQHIYGTTLHGDTIVAGAGGVYPSANAAYDLGSTSYHWNKLWADYILKIVQNSSTTNTMYDILPLNGSSWLGGTSNIWSLAYIGQIGDSTHKATVYCNGLTACDLPTHNSGSEIMRKIKKPVIMDGHFGKGQYFTVADFPVEMKATFPQRYKDEKGDLVDNGEVEDIEIIRTIGIIVHTVTELLERLDKLEAKIG